MANQGQNIGYKAGEMTGQAQVCYYIICIPSPLQCLNRRRLDIPNFAYLDKFFWGCLSRWRKRSAWTRRPTSTRQPWTGSLAPPLTLAMTSKARLPLSFTRRVNPLETSLLPLEFSKSGCFAQLECHSRDRIAHRCYYFLVSCGFRFHGMTWWGSHSHVLNHRARHDISLALAGDWIKNLRWHWNVDWRASEEHGTRSSWSSEEHFGNEQ